MKPKHKHLYLFAIVLTFGIIYLSLVKRKNSLLKLIVFGKELSFASQSRKPYVPKWAGKLPARVSWCHRVITWKPVGLWQSSKHGTHTDVSDDKLLTTSIAISMPKRLQVGIFKWFWAVLPGQKQLCAFFRNKYGFQIGSAMEKKTLFWPGRNAQNGLILNVGRFLMCWFQWHRFWGCTFRSFWVLGYMYALSWKLFIIGLLLEYFATLLKSIPEENSCKMFHIFFTNCTFSYWKVKDVLGDKDQISSWEDKRKR